jgi:hypothetical protein
MVNLFVHRLGADAREYRIAARTPLRVDLGANPLNSALAIGATLATRAGYGLPVLLLLLSLGVCVAAPAPITISVTPTACVISGQPGGSFAPPQCVYVVTADRDWANVGVSGIPPWLIASTTFGRTPLTVTLALDQSYAAQQLDGNYSATISFSNITGGAGSTKRGALLMVTELGLSPPPPATGPVVIATTSPPPPSDGYLLSDVGEVLITNTGDRLFWK